MRTRSCLAWFVAALILPAISASCGGRTEMPGGAPLASGGSGSGGAPAGCSSDMECAIDDLCVTSRCEAGACVVAAISCDDGDACSEDACDSLIGCVHRPSTFDADGDGFNGPLAGHDPGEP